MDAFVVKVHEETSKGMKRLYLYPLFLYTIKKAENILLYIQV